MFSSFQLFNLEFHQDNMSMKSKPYFYIEILGFTGVYLFFLIFDPKHRLLVLIRTALVRQF